MKKIIMMCLPVIIVSFLVGCTKANENSVNDANEKYIDGGNNVSDDPISLDNVDSNDDVYGD